MKLTTPVTAFGKQITEITFRTPTGKDIRQHGFPFEMKSYIDGSTTQKMDAGVIGALGAALGNVPSDAIDQLTPADFMTLTGEVLGFFGAAPAAAPSSQDAGNSQGSSEASTPSN